MVATCLWYVSNKFLMKPTMNAMKQDVEWGFCFDVHLNAFIPILVILHFIQLFFSVLAQKGVEHEAAGRSDGC